MAKRDLTSWLAAFGVLLHALALVGHNGAMLRMALADAVPGFDYGIICRGDGSRAGLQTLPGSEETGGVAKHAGKTSCPLCASGASAFALAAPAAPSIAAPSVVRDRAVPMQLALQPIPHDPSPPSTGPPAA